MFSDKKLSNRGIFLALGVFAMLFSGVLYAWSILKVPFATELGFEKSSLAFNFTLTMCFFCIGVFLASKLIKLLGSKLSIILSGILVGLGFILTGCVTGSVVYLYIFYAVFAGLGIGVAYNVVLSTVSAWFPDKKGFCSGMLMMAFGASTLILGKIIEYLFAKENIGWEKTYVILGIALTVVLVITGLLIKRPHESVKFPEIKVKKKANNESFEAKLLGIATP